eukprot:CAMPEP_0168312012 /NCGR_PEP_ID=MMETSP0142_2-20121227/67669_1 /TAXON_ID=44445 /ORGANISM="Pseudo-nitzschia australis, Strain 10249 10 AB" /LENGTH=435 /DNA_ID=CAMNT_0008264945 /DNA_START=164 /DNA_END=1471 /DNA_ORIENTATION=+
MALRKLGTTILLSAVLFGTTVDAEFTRHDQIVTWVRSKGGSFSEKVEIRRVDTSDPKSYWGVFAKEDIAAKEDLFNIPKDCYIHVFDTAENMNVEEEMEPYLNNVCKLTHKLKEEMKLGEKSEYAPYIAYLKTQRPGQLPANWSKEGKDILRKVAIPNSPMVDWIDWHFKEKNSHKLKEEMKLGEKSEYAPYIAYLKTQRPGQLPANWSKEGKDILRKVAIPNSPMVDWIDWHFKEKNCIGNDSFEEHMVEMTIQRSYDTALIPIWDMVNHDNGRINTENDTMYHKDGMKVRAARNLKAGEEIFASYDSCLDCYDINSYWGTPEILKDFGFVENYPHRWVFNDPAIWFEIYEHDGELEVYFSEEDEPLNEDQIRFLQKELDRLEKVEDDVLQNQGAVPDNEWRTILQFHDAAVDDIEVVIKMATDVLSNADNNEL